MPKLRPLSATEVSRLLREHVVPVPNRREIPVGTLKSNIALSGLDESLFWK